MTDLSKTIAPKSDQLNADDLIAGPMTIRVTDVRGCDEGEQPIAVHFEGDGGKPYKPCKSMRRVLVHCWGKDGATYAGRRLTLYRDDKVTFGGIQVGGIRISHMSHIRGDMTMALTASKAKRAPFMVRAMRDDEATRQATKPTPVEDAPPPMDLDPPLEDLGPNDPPWDAAAYAQGQRDNADRITDEPTLRQWWSQLGSEPDFKRLVTADADEAAKTRSHVQARLKQLKGA